jgi:hypothetical protein
MQFSALEILSDDVDSTKPWKSIKKNIKLTAKENIVTYGWNKNAHS